MHTNYSSPKFYNPQIIEETARGERSFDIYSRLTKDRIIILGEEVADNMANDIVAQLLYLDSIDHESPIHMYINSPGGSCTAGLAIYDTMQHIKAPVYTYAIGEACSMGAFLLSSGEPGHRYASANATIMTHRVSSGYQGNIQDEIVRLEYTKALDQRLAEILAKNCHMSVDEYLTHNVRDNFMFPEKALEFGIIDAIL